MNKEIKKAYKLHLINGSTKDWYNFIEGKDKDEVWEVIVHMQKVQDRLRKFFNGYYHTTKIRKYCNHHGYSDIEPYEVVRVISDKTVEVRQMIATQIKFPQVWEKGGFAGHCVDNNNQAYEYETNKTAPIIRVRKTKNGWKHHGMRFQMSDKPFKFYDYNF